MAFVSPLRLFFIRANVRAYLLAVGEFQTFADAFGPLLNDAQASGLLDLVGGDALQAIVERACEHAALSPIDRPEAAE